jgi:hypothetical protein
MGRGCAEKAGRNRVNLFKIFGEITLKGATATVKDLKTVNDAAGGTAKDLQKISESVTDTGKTMTLWATGPIVAVGTAILGMATSIGNAADRILDLNAITGMSTQAIQEFQYAAGIAGTPVEAATVAMKMFNAQLDAVAKGTGPVNDALIALGVNTEQFLKLNTEQQLSVMIAKLQEIEDPAERARMGIELFGRQWEGLAPIVALGAEGLDKARAAGAAFAENEEQLNAANNFRIAMFELKTIISEVVESLSYALLPAATSMVEVFRDNALPVIVSLVGYLQTAAEWFGSLPGPVQATIVTIVGLVAAIGPALLILGKLITIAGTITATFGTVMAAVKGFGVAVASTNPIVLAIIAAVAAAIAIYQNWEAIIRAFSSVWDSFKAGLAGAGEAIVSFAENAMATISGMVDLIVGYITGMGTKVVDGVKSMVDGALAALTSLYDAAVGNSIIPDLVKGVSDEMKLMAENGDRYANQFADTVQSALTGISAPDVAMAGASAAGGRSGQAMSTVSIDMRGSIFRDDKDMLRRLDRGGAGMQGF